MMGKPFTFNRVKFRLSCLGFDTKHFTWERCGEEVAKILCVKKPNTLEGIKEICKEFHRRYGPYGECYTKMPPKKRCKPHPNDKQAQLRNELAKKREIEREASLAFYRSDEWRRLRYEALKACGAQCCLCGRSRKHGIVLHVDHIEPVSKRPDLKLTLSNLQVLCEDCNLGKSNRDNTDWR